MKGGKQSAWWLVCASVMAICTPHNVDGQAMPYARSFSYPQAKVEQALKDMQAYSGQKLPILTGFVATGNQPLEQFERGFYQFAIEVLPGSDGATVVRLTAKITAWYADRDVAKSGYQELTSNGRLELDLLDRLGDQLSGKPSAPKPAAMNEQPTPKPKLDLSGIPGGAMPKASTPVAHTPDEIALLKVKREASERRVQQLSTELKNLKEIQSTQVHPQNLVTVKKSDTPMYAKAAESSRVLFQSTANDEFEFLDGDSEWIHVEISGDSRGYLRRGSVEVPERLAAKLQAVVAPSPDEKFAGFRVEREESSMFPGDWAALKGKRVKIYTVQPVSQNQKETGPSARLAYTLALFQKGLKEASGTNPAPEGVVVIFDAADGGIAGATMADIQKVSSGAITREIFWEQCYLDPVEAFRAASK